MPEGDSIQNECLFASVALKTAKKRGRGCQAKKDRGFCKFIRLPATTNFHRARMRPPNPLWRLFISSAPGLSSNLRSRAPSLLFARYRLYHARYTNLSLDSSWYSRLLMYFVVFFFSFCLFSLVRKMKAFGGWRLTN